MSPHVNFYSLHRFLDIVMNNCQPSVQNTAMGLGLIRLTKSGSSEAITGHICLVKIVNMSDQLLLHETVIIVETCLRNLEEFITLLIILWILVNLRDDGNLLVVSTAHPKARTTLYLVFSWPTFPHPCSYCTRYIQFQNISLAPYQSMRSHIHVFK